MEDFVKHKQACRLRDIGFNDPCMDATDILEYQHQDVPIPTFSQAFRWIRRKYKWFHSIDPIASQHTNKVGYNWWIWNCINGEEYHSIPEEKPIGEWSHAEYEDAESDCLDELLNLIERK